MYYYLSEVFLLMKIGKFTKKALAILVSAVLALSLVVMLAGCDQVPSDRDSGLTGTWNWDVTEEAYYTFNSDGTGTMEGYGDIRWGTSGGNIVVCVTVSDCGNSCPAPEELPYTLDGDSLKVTIQGTSYEYTRA
jgi:hypothetical protein